jgi:fatty-acyl-CoA synthase
MPGNLWRTPRDLRKSLDSVSKPVLRRIGEQQLIAFGFAWLVRRRFFWVITELNKELAEDIASKIARVNVLRRLVKVEDFAAVAYLLGDDSQEHDRHGDHGRRREFRMSATRGETVQTSARPGASASRAWLRALELTEPIPRQRERVLPAVVDELGDRLGDKPALLSDGESFTYFELAGRVRRYARWALAQGVAKGDVVCLLMPNCPEYLAIWLGITRVGGVVALLNTNIAGQSLAHCIQAASAKHLIVARELADALHSALPRLAAPPQVWVHGEGRGIDDMIEGFADAPLEAWELREITIDNRALCIFTSGTTGMPKAANVSHARVMQWGLWFAGMMDARPSDRLYSCLPMYHSVGGVLAPGAMLAAGGSLVVRERFSASQFWCDIIRWECTAIQYIGELCRYLLHCPYAANETAHRLRLACGNGLSANVWEAFQQRFRIPQILEFFAATEGGISLFNVQGKPGAIGHIPSYLRHRFAPALVAFDFDKGEPARNENGFCIPCRVNEPGEAIGKVRNDPAGAGSRFEGYTSAVETEKRILRDVFAAGDAWVRTGDLMRQDEKGFFYFVDRIGDTFRWKGENVATCEVAQVLCASEGIVHANVYGVAIPGTEGRAGMAAIVCDGALDLAALHRDLAERLPHYACPLFLRLCQQAPLTGTFKYAKTDLVGQAFNPSQCADPLYFNHPELRAYVALDAPLYESILAGAIRL